jgi:type I restriction enzyme S subunit
MSEPAESKLPKIRFKGHSQTWKTEAVSMLLTERNVQAPKSADYPLMAFIAGQGVAPKGSRYNREFLVSDELNKKYKQTELGDFIYSSNNLETGSIGTNRYGSASISPVYSIFAPTPDGDSSFIGQLLCKKAFINEMVKWRQGVVYGQWRIHESDFLKIESTFPSVDEQAQIGSYFQEVDRLIGLQQRTHDKLVTLKNAMFQKMFPKPGTTTPEIRFKGFSGEWDARPLRRITSKVTEKNVARKYAETFTNSAEFGIISQRDYFEKDISNAKNIGGYYIVEPECFVYNPRISELAPVGPVNRNKLGRSGIMSPLYTVFRTREVDNTFLEYFFKTNIWHPFMFLNGDTGARADRFSIKEAVFTELPVPYPDRREQQKIGNYFRTLDELISRNAIQLEMLKQIKAAFLEKMFV